MPVSSSPELAGRETHINRSHFAVRQTCCSVTQLCLCGPHGPQCARLPCPLTSPGVCSNSWSVGVGDTISPSLPSLLPCLQSSQHQSFLRAVHIIIGGGGGFLEGKGFGVSSVNENEMFGMKVMKAVCLCVPCEFEVFQPENSMC